MSSTLSDRFCGSDHAESYRKYRPNYPAELYQVVFDFLGQKFPGPYTRAVDVGCGSGQFTANLAPHFDKVLATDPSEAMIANAVRAQTDNRIEFRVGTCNDMLLPDASAELVTVATAVHWFDPVETFYREADRVLKPGGVLALVGCFLPAVSVNGQHSQEISDLVMDFFNDPRFAEYRTDRPRLLANRYRDFEVPYAETRRITDMEMREDVTIDRLVGLLRTRSFYTTYRRAQPDSDPLQEMILKLKDIIGTDRRLDEFKCTLHHPVFVVMGRKPLQ